MKVLAFDLGTKCGWAAGPTESGTFDFKRKRFEGGGMIFVRFRAAVRELLDTVKPGTVYYEEVRRHLGTDAAHLYGGFQAILTEECEARSIPYAGVPVQTIKKHATGKGNADKAAMLAAAKARGWAVEDDNHADALWLLDYVNSTIALADSGA